MKKMYSSPYEESILGLNNKRAGPIFLVLNWFLGNERAESGMGLVCYM